MSGDLWPSVRIDEWGFKELKGCSLRVAWAYQPIGLTAKRTRIHVRSVGESSVVIWKLFPWAGQTSQNRIFQTCSWEHVLAQVLWEPSWGKVLTFTHFSLFRLILTSAPHPHHHISPTHLSLWFLRAAFSVSIERKSLLSCTDGEGPVTCWVGSTRGSGGFFAPCRGSWCYF